MNRLLAKLVANQIRKIFLIEKQILFGTNLLVKKNVTTLLKILFTFRRFKPAVFVCKFLVSYNLLFLQVSILVRYETYSYNKFHIMF